MKGVPVLSLMWKQSGMGFLSFELVENISDHFWIAEGSVPVPESVENCANDVFRPAPFE